MNYLATSLNKRYLTSLLISSALTLTGCYTDNDDDNDVLKIDNVPPIITLTGDENITIFQNSTYVDQGATASDNIDANVVVSTLGTVNETLVGEYVLTYSAKDAANNESTKTRTVKVTPVTLSGTAAGGAAIVGVVIVKGANGGVVSEEIEADGSYEIDVTSLTAPYRLRAEGTVGGKSYKLHSYTEEATIGGTVNITPFTDLIVANTAQQLAEDFFDSNSDTSLDVDELSAQEDALQAKLQNVFDELGLDSAIDLLKTSFTADHSGLDAALDIISISTDADNNIATITNLIDDSSITDDITQADDNDTAIEITVGSIDTSVSDTQAIANLFDAFTDEFTDALPEEDDITLYFSEDFLFEDGSLALFLTNILTESDLIGLSFISLSVNDLDSEAGTASVSFNVAIDGEIDSEPEQWFVSKDDTLGWLFLGDQKIVDLDEFTFHCNDNNGFDDAPGGCGINTRFEDNNLSNNGTDGEPILSASVSIIDGVDGTIKDIFYLGTSEFSSEGHIYHEGDEQYTWDWRPFGTSPGSIDPTIFASGDIVEYNLYEDNLDLSDPKQPSVTGSPVDTYSHFINYVPQIVGKYPEANESSLENIQNFALGDDLTLEWSLAEGTRSSEVSIHIDQNENYLDVWEEVSASQTSLTIDKESFDAEFGDNQFFNPIEAYNVTVHIYAEDVITGQSHSINYSVTVPADESIIED
jgi:hypothetical protein